MSFWAKRNDDKYVSNKPILWPSLACLMTGSSGLNRHPPQSSLTSCQTSSMVIPHLSPLASLGLSVTASSLLATAWRLPWRPIWPTAFECQVGLCFTELIPLGHLRSCPDTKRLNFSAIKALICSWRLIYSFIIFKFRHSLSKYFYST